MEVQGPFLVIPTKRGAVPSLTPAQANAILEPSERLLATSIFEAVDFAKACDESGLSLSSYGGLEGYKTVLTVRSSFQGAHASAASTDAAMAGDNERGRVVMTVEKWGELVKATKPFLAVELHESVPLAEPLSRRRRVAVTRSDTWHFKTQELKDLPCAVLPSVSVSATHAEGFIDAVPREENTLEFYRTLQALKLPSPGCSMCVTHGLAAVVAAMMSNVTFIECPLPWVLAAKGIAIVLPTLESGGDHAAAAKSFSPIMDFNDNQFTLDISPIAADCPCFTCRRHTRAYLHHLLTVQEMNTDIFLSIHNLTQLVRLVRAYRGANTEDRDALVRRVLAVL